MLENRTPHQPDDGGNASYGTQANAGLFDCRPHGCPYRSTVKHNGAA
jgi:hypothetical protein